MKQLPLALAPAPEASFDNFVTGRNAAAVQALRGDAWQAIYLWGPSGCGKTHLLEALARAPVRCVRLSAATPLPLDVGPGIALALVDDCDALDAPRQRAAFALFVEAAASGWRVAGAGRVPPVDLPLRDDLRTRLGGGLVYAVQPLGDGEARAALRHDAVRRGITLSDDVIDYLLTRFARDLKHLMGLLERIDDYALGEQRSVTVPLLRRMFAEQEGVR